MGAPLNDTATATLPEVEGLELKSTVEDKVNEQYDSDASMAFYEHVMGGGGDDIHYGIFKTERDGLKESSQNSIEELAAMAVACGALKKGGGSDVKVLDLGSGKGGAARYLAKTYGCHVTCFNLGEKQNEFNKAKATSDGIGELIDTHLGSFNEPLPVDWTDSFDLVWSQEAFCHCMHQQALMSEIQRVLKPGGTVVFSDIMQGDTGGDCSSFTGQNVTTKLATPQTYKDAIRNTGMKLAEHKDLTEHLTQYFKCMLHAVKESKLPLQMKGVSMARLDAYEEDLVTRFDAVKQRAFAWGMFSAQNLFSSDALLNGALNADGQCPGEVEEWINSQYDSEISMNFYKFTMGGGSDYVHYGIFNSPDEDLAAAAHNTVLLMSELARRASNLGLQRGGHTRVLDLGSGKGGAARHLATNYGCHVTCYNLGENQNKHNHDEAAAANISHLIECKQGNFNYGLPAEWTASFDLVWSQEALCHADNQQAVLRDIKRVLKPGGVAVFTDIMRTMASSADLTAFDVECDAVSSPRDGSTATPDSPDNRSPEPRGMPIKAHPSPSPLQGAAVERADSSPSLSGSYGNSLLSGPKDFTMSSKRASVEGHSLHATSPGMYMHNISSVGLDLVDYRDLTEHLGSFYTGMMDELKKNEEDLIDSGVNGGRLSAMRVDMQHRLQALKCGSLAWGAFTVRKPANSRALVIGGGPLGAFTAVRLSQSGVSNVTVKVLPSSPSNVIEMVSLAGVSVVENWEDITHTNWGSIIIAVKTHWLPQIAMEMSCAQIDFENLCMVYNGYTQTPEYFSSMKCCRAVVPQSFSFDSSALIAWDVKHGNAHNPWTLPTGKTSASIVGQLVQSGVVAKCDPAFHRSAFFKFCVNNAANLLSVIEGKCCRDLVGDPECLATMKAILAETFDVLELDPFYAAVVPMHREEFVHEVLLGAKGSVASYSGHFPSSYQHYMSKKLVDTRALNAFVMRKAKELNTQAPINEYIARQVIAISNATTHGIPRPEWDARVKLSAAKRLIDNMGLAVSVWGHASVRGPTAATMLLAPFGESFSHAHASGLRATPLHPSALDDALRATTNITAVVLHGAVYSQRSDAGCVLHTHSPYATALAAADLAFDPEIVQDAMQFVGRVGYHDFGGVADESEEMELVARVAQNADVLFLRNHGVIVVGEDVETAFSRLFYLERCCQTQLLVAGAGAKVTAAGATGVKHTVDWYRQDGRESAHAEWKAHIRDLLHVECTSARTKPFWYE